MASPFPILPSSIAPQSIIVSLHCDLIEFMNMCRWHLLFFERPIALMSTCSFDYLTAEAEQDFRNGKAPKTFITDDEQNLKNTFVLMTDEWTEIMSYFERWEMEVRVGDAGANEDEEMHRMRSLLAPTGALRRDDRKTGSQFPDDLLDWILVANCRRLESAALAAAKRNTHIVFTDPMDQFLCRQTTRALLGQLEGEEDACGNERDIRRLLRTIQAAEVLKAIEDLEIVSLSTVPVSRIVEFRKKNAALSQHFLAVVQSVWYEIEQDPKGTARIARDFKGKIVGELVRLNQELLCLREHRKFDWLEAGNETAFDLARGGYLASLLGAFAIPQVWSTLLRFLSKGARAENAKLQALTRSHCGYLWKAMDTFKKIDDA